MIFTADLLNCPLARLGVTYGFLELNILALADNFVFLASRDKAWETLQLGPLLRLEPGTEDVLSAELEQWDDGVVVHII